IIDLLVTEMKQANVELRLQTVVESIEATADGYTVALSGERVRCTSLVVACGGKSIPKMGATGFGYDVARQFGLALTDIRPALVPLTFDDNTL
ncbi:NAD(P)/FAD-dependent oxidoreductase, partial [Mycobacterium tuberculosis]|nr:NAD(P)/FAD-dependent oxidoreductase [Mycobacterium tuberculosis]